MADFNLSEEQSDGLSVINNPFTSDCVTNMWISYYNSGFGRPHWSGKVSFKNGKTTGEQKTNNVETFDEVVAEMKQILNTIKQ